MDTQFQLRSNGKLLSYLQGIRSIFLSPVLFINNNYHPFYPPPSNNKNNSSNNDKDKIRNETISANIKNGNLIGQVECNETKNGLQYTLSLTPTTTLASESSVIFRMNLFTSVWANASLNINKHNVFTIKENEEEECKTEEWKTANMSVTTLFDTNVSFEISDNESVIKEASWKATEVFEKNGFSFLQLDINIPVEDWMKNETRKFCLSLSFHNWTASLLPKGSITDEQKNTLFTEGYVNLPNQISGDLCDNLVRAINHQMGLASLMAKKNRSQQIKDNRGKNKKDNKSHAGNRNNKNKKNNNEDNKNEEEEGEEEEENKKEENDKNNKNNKSNNNKIQGAVTGNFYPALKQSPLLVDLVNGSQVHDILEAVLGPGNVVQNKTGQIALRHPTTQDPLVSRLAKNSAPIKPSAFTKAEYHIDGKNDGENSIREGTIGNFTLLVGVILKDLPNTESGNLIVYPRTHWKHAAYFKRDSPESFLIGEGMPSYFTKDSQLPEPTQICGKKGDVILCHFLLGHSVSPNYSTDIRYVTYFRVNTASLLRDKDKKKGHDSMVNLWQDWHGMESLAQRQTIEDFYKI